MAIVVVNSFLAQFIASLPAGKNTPEENTERHIEANTVRELIRKLDQQYPGVAAALSSGVAVAIDGELHSDALLMDLEEDSEVFFLPAIEGG